MCAINPKFKDSFMLNVYTANPSTTKEEFDKLIMEKVLEIEQKLNEDGRLRWHIAYEGGQT